MEKSKITEHLTSLPKDWRACQFLSNARAKHFPSVNTKPPFVFLVYSVFTVDHYGEDDGCALAPFKILRLIMIQSLTADSVSACLYTERRR